MKITPQLHREAPASTQVEEGACFYDLDETLLYGTVSAMTDQELADSQLNQAVLNSINRGRANGIKTVLATRNDNELYERFFDFYPEIRYKFDAIFGGNFAKSGPINHFLQQNGLSASRSTLTDDNGSERTEVENNAGINAIDPSQSGYLN